MTQSFFLGGTPAEDPSGDPPAQVMRRWRSLQVVQGAPHRLDHGSGHVCVDLGGTRALVAKEFLDDTEIDAAFQQVRGEAVTTMRNSA